MNHFEYRGGVLSCEGVPLAEIAGAVGTPVYVYSTATLERHYDVFRAAFAPRDVMVAFAVKANANVAVLATLARKGAGADTVSQGEIERSLKAGVPPERIIFSGVGKTESELAFAVKTGVHQINVESEAELETLSRIAAGIGASPSIAIRVNPDVGAGGHEKRYGRCEKALTKRTKVIFVASPNNPTGNTTPKKEIMELVDTGRIVVVDEAYCEFGNVTVANSVPSSPNLIVLRTFSKWAGLAGLRIGYGFFPVEIAIA